MPDDLSDTGGDRTAPGQARSGARGVAHRQFVVAAAFLSAVAFAALPLWDAIGSYRMLQAMSGALGFGRGADAAFPSAGVGYPLAAVALGIALHSFYQRSVTMAFGLWALGASVVIIYASATGYDTALTRSRAVDSWLVCETGQYPDGGKGYPSAYKRTPSFDGPHLDHGDPCTQQSEDRLRHRTRSPGGELADGLLQIWKRFPHDRRRVVYGTLAVLLMVGGSGVLLRRANG